MSSLKKIRGITISEPDYWYWRLNQEICILPFVVNDLDKGQITRKQFDQILREREAAFISLLYEFAADYDDDLKNLKP